LIDSEFAGLEEKTSSNGAGNLDLSSGRGLTGVPGSLG
jgi:hypothetical protein